MHKRRNQYKNGQKEKASRKICEKRLARIMISGKILLDKAKRQKLP